MYAQTYELYIHIYELLKKKLFTFLYTLKRPEQILREARERMGLSQTDAGKAIGIGLRMYQKIEKGNFPKFKTEKVSQLDKLLGTKLHELLYEHKGHLKKESDYENNLVQEDEIPIIVSLKIKPDYVQRFTSLH